jgi:hypothetical protein
MTDEIDETEPQTIQDDPIAIAILDALADGSSLQFKDIAMRIFEARRKAKDRPDGWRRYLTSVRQQAIHLARQGRVEIMRKGEVADPEDFKGIVRVRLTGN